MLMTPCAAPKYILKPKCTVFLTSFFGASFVFDFDKADGSKHRNINLQVKISKLCSQCGNISSEFCTSVSITKVFLLEWLVDVSSASGVLFGGGGRQLKYLQSSSLVSSSFMSLTEKSQVN